MIWVKFEKQFPWISIFVTSQSGNFKYADSQPNDQFRIPNETPFLFSIFEFKTSFFFLNVIIAENTSIWIIPSNTQKWKRFEFRMNGSPWLCQRLFFFFNSLKSINDCYIKRNGIDFSKTNDLICEKKKKRIKVEIC